MIDKKIFLNNLIIRDMISEDIDSISEIEKMCFSDPWSRESIAYEYEQNSLAKYLVAEKENIVIGYIGVWLIGDEGHITNVAVHPSYRGLGIANAIMLKFIDDLSKLNIKSITLEVRQSNLIAQNLYKKFGFLAAGIRKKYYEDNKEDAIIMWKK